MTSFKSFFFKLCQVHSEFFQILNYPKKQVFFFEKNHSTQLKRTHIQLEMGEKRMSLHDWNDRETTIFRSIVRCLGDHPSE